MRTCELTQLLQLTLHAQQLSFIPHPDYALWAKLEKFYFQFFLGIIKNAYEQIYVEKWFD